MSKNYSGHSLEELCDGQIPANFYIPPIEPSKYHTVLFELPIDKASNSPPKPHVNTNPKHWNDGYVRMPYSPKNLYPVKDNNNGDETLKPRWELITKAFEKPISNVSELVNAINSYNRSLPVYYNLQHFFENELNEEESVSFFNDLLPKIIKLALRLPEIIPCSIPLLNRKNNRSISMSQLQIASLLANAFLCTFPWRKDVSTSYPGANFTRLFTIIHRPKRLDCIIEKLKCIIHYFRRITTSDPIGVVTFQRISLNKNEIPHWDRLDNNLGCTKIHISSTGTIEDSPIEMLQVDFANKNIGGGVLGYGCVQEEIRFVICPELIISRLFTEQLCDTEAAIIRGVERFSKYTGYSDTFKWEGNYVDSTPFDRFNRRKTAISVIDATHFNRKDSQYHPGAILRELGKAYTGFYSHHRENLSPVATGNWGCGAFQGDPQLKSLIQLIACSATRRHLVYYTFGNKELQDSFYSMYLFLATNNLKICELWKILSQFSSEKLPQDQFNSFVLQYCFDRKNKIEILPGKVHEKNVNATVLKVGSATTSKLNFYGDNKKQEPAKTDVENVLDTSLEMEQDHNSPDIICSTDDEDVIPSSQPSSNVKTKFFDKLLFRKNHEEIVSIFEKLDKK